MGILGFFRKRPEDQVIVFAGDRLEAELVMSMLQEEGFHPRLWADQPAPAYTGPIGTARVVVPPHEGGDASSFLASLRLSAQEAADEEDEEEADAEGTEAGGEE
jgi:hypothetical protein